MLRKCIPSFSMVLVNLGKNMRCHWRKVRNIPLPLRNKVQSELKCMELLGVISPVCSPTPWCASMVVVPGKVRICVNLKHLNECMQREYHPLPCSFENSHMSGLKVTPADTRHFSTASKWALCSAWDFPNMRTSSIRQTTPGIPFSNELTLK